MAWQTPKTDWTAADGVTNADLNRIEGNIAELKSSGNTTATSLNSHINNKSNPHGVTASQVGAASASHKHGGGDITSAVANANYATSAGNANYATSAGNADTVDGKHASELLSTQGLGSIWMAPSENVLYTHAETVQNYADGNQKWNSFIDFTPIYPGFYRVSGQARTTVSSTSIGVEISVRGVHSSRFTTSSTSFVNFSLDTPQPSTIIHPISVGCLSLLSNSVKAELRNVSLKGSKTIQNGEFYAVSKKI